jgi:hypothetical protein
MTIALDNELPEPRMFPQDNTQASRVLDHRFVLRGRLEVLVQIAYQHQTMNECELFPSRGG